MARRLGFVTAALATASVAGGSEPLSIGRDPQLFLDDFMVAQREDLRRVMHRPRRLADPVLDYASFATTQPYVSVVYDAGMQRYRLWYNNGSNVAHADSADGIHWENRRTVWELPRAYGCSLLDDGHRAADPARRYKMANWQATRAKEQTPNDDSGMYVAFSPDGLRWTPRETPVRSMWVAGYGRYVEHHVADIIDVYYDPIRGQYAAAVKQWAVRDEFQPGGPAVRTDGAPPVIDLERYAAEGQAIRRIVALTTSRDFVSWTDPWRIIVPDAQDEAWSAIEFYGLGGVHARGALLIGFVRVLRDDLPCEPGGAPNGIGYTTLAISRDGRQWHRFREPFLDRNPEPGTWDRAMTWIGAQAPAGDEVFLYYGGYARGHKADAWSGGRQFGLARIRKDGYVSLRAEEQPGILATPLFTFEGETLALNVAAGEKGSVRVEIQDDRGVAIDGYGLEHCDPIQTDSVSHTVTWEGRSDVSSLAERAVRLRIELRSANLYAFQFEGGP